MVDTEMFGDQLMLGADVVIEGDLRESRSELCIGRGGRLAIPKKRRDDDEVLKCV